MINTKAEFIIDGNKVKLMAFCNNCNKDIDVIDCIFHEIPSMLKFLPNKNEPIKEIQIKLRCPECYARFCINKLIYLGD